MVIQVSFSSPYSSDIAVDPIHQLSGRLVENSATNVNYCVGPQLLNIVIHQTTLSNVNAGHQLNNSIHIFDKQTTTNKRNIAHHVRNVTK